MSSSYIDSVLAKARVDRAIIKHSIDVDLFQAPTLIILIPNVCSDYPILETCLTLMSNHTVSNAASMRLYARLQQRTLALLSHFRS